MKFATLQAERGYINKKGIQTANRFVLLKSNPRKINALELSIK